MVAQFKRKFLVAEPSRFARRRHYKSHISAIKTRVVFTMRDQKIKKSRRSEMAMGGRMIFVYYVAAEHPFTTEHGRNRIMRKAYEIYHGILSKLFVLNNHLKL